MTPETNSQTSELSAKTHKAHLLGIAVHDWASPLTAMKGFVGFAQFNGQFPQKINDGFNKIVPLISAIIDTRDAMLRPSEITSVADVSDCLMDAIVLEPSDELNNRVIQFVAGVQAKTAGLMGAVSADHSLPPPIKRK